MNGACSQRNDRERGGCRNLEQQKRQRALELMLDGMSNAEVAAALGCRRETVWRWAQDPAFAGALIDARSDRRKKIRTRLETLTVQALDLLGAVMNDSKAGANTRVRAAMAILDRGLLIVHEEYERAGGEQSRDKLFDNWTREEIDVWCRTGHWPERVRPFLTRPK